MDPYESLNDAIYYAAKAAREKFANKAEAITIVYEHDGKFFFAPPTTTKRGDSKAQGAFKIPKTAVVRGIVHNHPEGRESDRFSPDDLAMAEKLKVPSAIVFGGSNPTIRLFTPGQTKIESDPRRRLKWSMGDSFAGTMQ